MDAAGVDRDGVALDVSDVEASHLMHAWRELPRRRIALLLLLGVVNALTVLAVRSHAVAIERAAQCRALAAKERTAREAIFAQARARRQFICGTNFPDLSREYEREAVEYEDEGYVPPSRWTSAEWRGTWPW